MTENNNEPYSFWANQAAANNTEPSAVTAADTGLDSAPASDNPQGFDSSAPASDNPQGFDSSAPASDNLQGFDSSAPASDNPQGFGSSASASDNPQGFGSSAPASDNPQGFGSSAPASDNPQGFGSSAPASDNLQNYSTASKKKKKRGRFLRRSAGLIASAAVFGIVAGGAFLGFNTLYYHLNPSAKPAVIGSSAQNGRPGNGDSNSVISSTTVSNGTSIATTDVSDIVEGAMPSLVSISCTFRTSSSVFGYLYEGTSQGSGSGIIVGRNDSELLIATNNHVIDKALTTKVTFKDGSEVDAVLKGADASSDLAIISVPTETIAQSTLDSITVATLGSSDDIKVGQMVIAIGNALGYGQTTTVGYVSAKEREITVTDSSTGASTTMSALQVDAAINPGNSGGALLNTKGEVIGINSAKLSGTSIEGIGYAIPISNVSEILTELMNREILSEDEQGYLAVYLSATDITEDVAASLGWPTGVYITETIEGGAAEKGGVLAGDIATAVNGVTMSTGAQLKETINSYRAGTTITLTIQRLENGIFKEHNLEITLGSRTDIGTQRN